MRSIGFEALLGERWLSPIIVTFFCPADPRFDFTQFYDLMKSKGFIIYPGKLTVVDSFRIGCIGQMDDQIMLKVVKAAKQSLQEMGVSDASPPIKALDIFPPPIKQYFFTNSSALKASGAKNRGFRCCGTRFSTPSPKYKAKALAHLNLFKV